ncbi:hypothetical protein B9Z55_028585 [Caenorhabditis nigoni]|nr:hypothetical protein B9Z55_028585 [Caenorhabditis nigoni]
MEVIKIMESKDQLAFSYCSKLCKKDISNLKIASMNSLKVNIESSITLECAFNDHFIFLEFDFNDSNAETPEERLFYHVQHLLYIFNTSKIDILRFSIYCNNFNLDLLLQFFRSIRVKTLIITPLVEKHIYASILNSPIRSDRLMLEKNPFNDSSDIQKIFIQNRNSIYIWPGIRFELSDLLITNSKNIQIFGSIFTERELNRFLKLWILGANPKLEQLNIQCPRLLDEDAVIRGVRFREIRDLGRKFNFSRADGRANGILIMHLSAEVSHIDFSVE